MNPALWAVAGGVSTLLVVLAVLGLVLLLRRDRPRAAGEADLAAARQEVEALRSRVEELSAMLDKPRDPEPTDRAAGSAAHAAADYVITRAGEPQQPFSVVPERAVLSVTLGEPLVKAAAFGYGLRRALSAESRNRIAFEMRREVKRARKSRRRAARRTRIVDTEESAA